MIELLTNGIGHGNHVAQIGAAILIGRCTHRDEENLSVFNRRSGICCERQMTRRDGSSDNGIQSRLMDRNTSCLQHFDFSRVYVHTNDVMADVREAGTRNKSNIARAKNCNFHKSTLERKTIKNCCRASTTKTAMLPNRHCRQANA